jgi:thiosulfate/3-mercaptopyruvate sulfurtransferase
VDEFVERLRGWGVNDDSHVLVYDDRTSAFAARLWWMLGWLGHERVSVCDGGYQAWLASGGEPTMEVPDPERGNFSPNVRPELVLTSQAVLMRDPGFVLLDARNPERFRGEVEPIDSVAGHIPGARSCPFVDNLNASGRFRSQQELRARYSALLGDTPAERVGVYCGSGVTACHDILAAAHAGLGEFRLYAGSWSEWIVDPRRPVATGSV